MENSLKGIYRPVFTIIVTLLLFSAPGKIFAAELHAATLNMVPEKTRMTEKVVTALQQNNLYIDTCLFDTLNGIVRFAAWDKHTRNEYGFMNSSDYLGRFHKGHRIVDMEFDFYRKTVYIMYMKH